MALQLGDSVPNFQAETTAGNIDFYEYLGSSWGVLFSHPADYTPVCTTELGSVSKLQSEFASRNVKTIALSVDPLASHFEWIKDINETQNTELTFPLIADPNFEIANLYGMIHPNACLLYTSRCV